MNKPDDCLAECYLLLQVLKEEYEGDPGALIARFYYDAFQISITHGNNAVHSPLTMAIDHSLVNGHWSWHRANSGVGVNSLNIIAV